MHSPPMEKLSTWVTTIWLLLLLFRAAEAEQDDVKLSLVNFLKKLSGNDTDIDRKLGWNATFDPCVHQNWTGVNCSATTNSIKSIVLEGLGLSGSIDAGLLCKARSLSVLSLRDNALSGQLPADVSNCSQLTHLYVGGNRFSGSLPSSLELLNNLKRLNISYNGFSGELPDFSKISGLLTFLAQNNSLTGTIPAFHFTNLVSFNVSYNSLRGPVPENGGLFSVESFMGNLGLCGKPLPIACPPSPSPSPSLSTEEKGESKNSIGSKTIMLSGYIVLAVVFVLFLSYKVIYFLYKKQKKKKKKSEEMKGSGGDEKVASDDNSKPPSKSRSEYSLPSSADQSAHTASTSLVVLKDSASKKDLRFEDLLKAPAELMWRGRFGSLYKVTLQDGSALAVKRMKDLSISAEDFKRRMERIGRVKHINVLPAVAFYCSMQEKLVVYEFQKNGSLFKLLQGGGGDQKHNFGWSSRLNMATAIAEGLSFMHEELHEEGIAHGNFKSSNILFTANMDPCISEYGLTSPPSVLAAADHLLFSSSSRSSGESSSSAAAPFKSDVRSFGLVLLELLTGKAAHSDGSDLARWVQSVVREEWTVEVFDKRLLADGASQEGMVHLLQVALKCVNSAADACPTMREVAAMVNAVKEEEEERSIVSEEG